MSANPPRLYSILLNDRRNLRVSRSAEQRPDEGKGEKGGQAEAVISIAKWRNALQGVAPFALWRFLLLAKSKLPEVDD